ncbi:MAG: S1 RNA-binding domain-containing protein [Phycisphaerales bacterium]|nr:MAG: S1 RNA-binding domain-containing protein [Phycisphaerales bacterium]
MMSDVHEPHEPTGIPAADTTHNEPLADDLPASSEPAPDPGNMDDIDREVAAAMDSMSPEDRAELSGEVVVPQSIEVVSDEMMEPGAELIGTVAGVSDDEIFLEFGVKSQGVMPRSQFGKKEPVDVGRRVDVVVERFDPEANMLFVNRKGAIMRATWTNLSEGMLVEGRVTGLIKGGLEIDLKGIRAFMPASQVDTSPMKDISLLLNQPIRAEVMELDRRAKNVLLSRRRLMEREQAEAREKLEAELAVGQVRKGRVSTIMEYGAFVDLGGIDGLVHIRDLSWGTVDKVSDVLSPGQEVEVQVLRIDTERNRISLGIKHCQPDPWADAEQRFPVGTEIKTRIIRLANFGAFAELEPGVEGLIPVSEMSWKRVNLPSDAVSVGDVVDALVIRLEREKHRIALSIKQAQPDPWEAVLESFAPQSLATGKVTRLTDFGAFVELVPGVEGLIHISELADGRVKSCSDVVSVGAEVETRVLGVDKENRRISLSIKAVNAPTEPDVAPAPRDDEKPRKSKKRKKPLRGGLSSHFDW